MKLRPQHKEKTNPSLDWGFGQTEFGFGNYPGASAGSGLITGVTVLGDTTINITNPSALAVPMQTNGTAIKINTSGTAAVASVDVTKILINCVERGWNTDGSVNTARARTIGVRGALLGPYNELSAYQPVLGEFYLKTDGFIFNQDATWKTVVNSITFQAGWLPGAAAETVYSVTRQDSLAYLPIPIKIPTHPFQNIQSGDSIVVEYGVGPDMPVNMSPLACVEAWAVDNTSAAGTVVRQSSFVRSPNTPNDATNRGNPCPSYALTVSPAGLAAGRCGVRATFKPWYGPSVDQFTHPYAETYPTYNLPVELPFYYDPVGNYASLYGCICNIEGASMPGLTSRITNNTSTTTASTAGLCFTKAGAIASGVFYDNLQTFYAAVHHFNNSGSNLTILSNDGLSTQSTKRTTTHADSDGGIAVCIAVPSSIAGADLGAYALTADCSGFVTNTVGVEIQSYDNLPHDTVRWRGIKSDGSTLAFTSRRVPLRIRLRGIRYDSTGVTVTASNNIVLSHGSAAGAPTTKLSEAAAAYVVRIDCDGANPDPAVLAIGTSILQFQSGYRWDIRYAETNVQTAQSIMSSANVYSGLVASIGCSYAGVNTTLLFAGLAPCSMGTKFIEIGVTQSGLANIKPLVTGYLVDHCDISSSKTSITQSLFGWGGGGYGAAMPIVGGAAIVQTLVYHSGTTNSGSLVGLYADGSRLECDNLIIDGCTFAAPNGTSAGSRLNIGYNESGYIRINKRISIRSTVARQWNTKSGPFTASETPVTANFSDGAHSTSLAYNKGAVVTSGGLAYQALVNIPASSGIVVTDTDYWYASGIGTGVAYGSKPLREGNNDLKCSVNCFGNVTCETANSDPSPSAAAWYGIYWDTSSIYNATYGALGSNFWTSPGTGDLSPKTGGPLKNRVPTGKAGSPFDLHGNALLNDNTDSAGCLQAAE